ncbi:MAG: hypothetical protein VR67_17570 [Peptococcaceae bacterium BRH_c8a]|nr:MAG: hypothetical protein VR67_17570 [Peptococcaceae bacterium BRH_c8a]
MNEPIQKFNLPVISILTGFAFMIGGLLKTLGIYLIFSESFLLNFIVIWFGFLVEAAIGMAVLAFLLRRHYPFRKLWLAGTGAFALGILFPALILNQFFYALLILPGFLVGFFFRQLLDEKIERKNLLFMTTLGFLICQIMILIFQPGNDICIWLREHLGPLSDSFYMHIVIIDAIIGFFVAIGVGLMVRKDKQEINV